MGAANVDRLEITIARSDLADVWQVTIPITYDDGASETVTFRLREGDSVPELVGATLERSEGRIAPSDLQRFAWSRWSTIATAALRRHLAGQAQVPIEHGEPLMVAVNVAMGADQPRRRPGPRSTRGPEFFRGIADRYEALVAAGELKPTQRLAQERGYNRNTMAAFVRKARAMNFLGPAKHGRTG